MKHTPRGFVSREPIIAAEIPRFVVFALAMASAIYGTERFLKIAAGIFALATSVVLSCILRVMSIPVLLPREPDIHEPPPAGEVTEES